MHPGRPDSTCESHPKRVSPTIQDVTGRNGEKSGAAATDVGDAGSYDEDTAAANTGPTFRYTNADPGRFDTKL